MDAVLYNLKTQERITKSKTFVDSLKSPTTWNWLTLSGYSFNPELLEKFLIKHGVDKPKIDYYIRPNSTSWGSLYMSPACLYFTDNNLLWEIPYVSLSKFRLIKKEGAGRLMQQTHIDVAFKFESSVKHYLIFVPINYRETDEVDLSDNISTEQTENLFRAVKERVLLTFPELSNLFS